MKSMTGFASVEGDAGGAPPGKRWRWEAKSVNGRGLDVRFRLSDGMEALEPELRTRAAKTLARGNVTIHLRIEDQAGQGEPSLNESALMAVIAAAAQGERAASDAGLHLAPTTIGQLLSVRGVVEIAAPEQSENDAAAFKTALVVGFSDLIKELDAARAAEGARIADTFTTLIDQIEALTDRAEAAHAAALDGAPDRLRDKLAAVREAGPEIDPDRLTQELALLAVKADAREELDRLKTHIAAARDLISAQGPVGRKLDFLTQEFNREANTLCSKSGSKDLTAAGLELKVAIDQMREQAQNVE